MNALRMGKVFWDHDRAGKAPKCQFSGSIRQVAVAWSGFLLSSALTQGDDSFEGEDKKDKGCNKPCVGDGLEILNRGSSQ